MPRLGLRHQLFAWFFLAGVTPAFLGIASLYGLARSDRAREASAGLQTRAETAAERLTLALDATRRALTFVAEQAQRARDAKARPTWDAAAGYLSTWGDHAPIPVSTLAVYNAA